MSRKENALDLAKFVDKGVRVKLSGGREGTQYSRAQTLSRSRDRCRSCALTQYMLCEVTFIFLLQFKVH